MNNSPFGQYAPMVAAITALAIILAFLASQIAPTIVVPSQTLNDFAWGAFGVIFGSALTVNGWKQPLSANSAKIDRIATAVQTVAASSPSVDSGQIAAVLAGTSTAPPTAEPPPYTGP